MKNFINTIRNIFKIEDLRVRIYNTLLILVIYRLGTFITLPGVDSEALSQLSQQTDTGILDLINTFAGGAFARASIFALGIMPYISASIVVQLLAIAVPTFQKMQKEGEDGRRKINQITRVLTIVITAFQAIAYMNNLYAQSAGAIITTLSPFMFMFSSVTIMVAGTMFTMWLGERITEKGLGNGISLIIMVGIIASLPMALLNEATATDPLSFIIEMIIWLAVILSVILLVQGTRRIPVQYAKRIVGNKQYGGVRQYIPLKVNAAGVMPIIFAQALMFIPPTLANAFDAQSGFVSWFVDFTSVPYNIIFGSLIILFTYFYTALQVNPNQIADDLKRNNGYIPGIKPGKKTAEFIENVLSRITLPGSFFLAFVAVLPAFATGLFGVNSQFAQFYGGTSLLILVGVILDTLQQIESHLLMRHYDGLMKTGRIKGRANAVGAAI